MTGCDTALPPNSPRATALVGPAERSPLSTTSALAAPAGGLAERRDGAAATLHVTTIIRVAHNGRAARPGARPVLAGQQPAQATMTARAGETCPRAQRAPQGSNCARERGIL